MLDLKKNPYKLYLGDKFVAAFSNEALAVRTGLERAKKGNHSVTGPRGTIACTDYLISEGQGGFVVIRGVSVAGVPAFDERLPAA